MMNWFDVAVAVVVGVGAVRGFSTGIIREALSVVGLVGGIILAGQRYQALAERLTFISDPSLASVVAFTIIFVAVGVAAGLLGQILHRVAKLALMGGADRMFGLVFGAVEAVVLIQITLLLLLQFSFIGSMDFVQDSTIGLLLIQNSSYIVNILPVEFGDIPNLLKMIQ